MDEYGADTNRYSINHTALSYRRFSMGDKAQQAWRGFLRILYLGVNSEYLFNGYYFGDSVMTDQHTAQLNEYELEQEESAPHLQLPRRGMPTLEDFDRDLEVLSYYEGLEDED